MLPKKSIPGYTDKNRTYNLFWKAINCAKKLYYTLMYVEMTKTWKGINKIVNNKVGLNSNITQINKNGKSITDPKEIGNTFNNFFVNIDKTIPKPFESPTT